mmetsp:Transcript_21180/g.35686  ORF Transcript_21180/g.35686 Transcript_21180/m.35686 type:complete len:223 (+) Transcript_21180:611-1279(+)
MFDVAQHIPHQSVYRADVILSLVFLEVLHFLHSWQPLQPQHSLHLLQSRLHGTGKVEQDGGFAERSHPRLLVENENGGAGGELVDLLEQGRVGVCPPQTFVGFREAFIYVHIGFVDFSFGCSISELLDIRDEQTATWVRVEAVFEYVLRLVHHLCAIAVAHHMALEQVGGPQQVSPPLSNPWAWRSGGRCVTFVVIERQIPGHGLVVIVDVVQECHHLISKD